MTDFHCWILNVKLVVLEVFWAQAKSFDFPAKMALFSFLILQIIRKTMLDFYCWIPYVNKWFRRFLLAQAQIFDFLQEWLYFWVFLSKAQKKYARFQLLNSDCKDNYFKRFLGPRNKPILSQTGLLFSFLFLQIIRKPMLDCLCWTESLPDLAFPTNRIATQPSPWKELLPGLAHEQDCYLAVPTNRNAT